MINKPNILMRRISVVSRQLLSFSLMFVKMGEKPAHFLHPINQPLNQPVRLSVHKIFLGTQKNWVIGISTLC